MTEPTAKQKFIGKVKENLSVVNGGLNLSNQEFIQWTDNFCESNRKKQWSMLNARFVAGLNILFTILFGKKRFGYDIQHRGEINLNNLWKAYTKYTPFDLLHEIPLIFYYENSDYGFLVTNKYLYFSLNKSKKIKDINKTSIGKIDLTRIRTVTTKRGTISKNSIDITINGELIGGTTFWVSGDAKILKKYLNHMVDNRLDILNKQTNNADDINDYVSVNDNDISNKLTKLKQLLEKELISEKEYKSSKENILRNI